MDLFEKFENTDWPTWSDRQQLVLEERKRFIQMFPIERIADLTLDEYLISKKGSGNEDSFCRILRYGLRHICSMGNAFPDVFGIYLKDGNEITLSKTFQKKHGDNYEVAFADIKNEIVTLLKEVNDDHFDAIERCELNNTFKYKLIATYFFRKGYSSSDVSCFKCIL